MVGEALLVPSLEFVVELLTQSVAQLFGDGRRVDAGEQHAEATKDRIVGAQVRLDRLGHPWVLHLDRHRSTVARHCSMDLTDRRRGDRDRIPLGEQIVRMPTEFIEDHTRRQLARHRWSTGLELSEILSNVVGKSEVQIAGHLAELHHCALQVSEGVDDVLGRRELELIVELHPTFGRRKRFLGPSHCPSTARTGPDPSDLRISSEAEGVPAHRLLLTLTKKDERRGDQGRRKQESHKSAHGFRPIIRLRACCERRHGARECRFL